MMLDVPIDISVAVETAVGSERWAEHGQLSFLAFECTSVPSGDRHPFFSL